jgi:hypothetical protein
MTYPGRAESKVRKKFAGQEDRVDEKSSETLATGKRFALLFSFFLAPLHVLVIL